MKYDMIPHHQQKGMKMLTLPEIQKALKKEDKDLVAVAYHTKISTRTLMTIRDGRNDNPTYKIMVALSKYLEGKTK